MKIQSMAVIFAIIILPVIIILSYYIHAEVDTIATQTAYDTKLIDATHDAMASFEINTANEDLSSVADALRSIIEASTNVFFNSLATNLGMSNANKDFVQSYIPAILYTLYDGYYIYSPTRVPEVLVANGDTVVYVGDSGVVANGSITTDTGKIIGKYKYNGDDYYVKDGNPNIFNSITSYPYEFGQMLFKNNDGSYSTALHNVSDGSNNGTYYKQDYVLKSYMPYSARYKSTGYDLTINYTLDNYLTVMGYIGNVYYSKTGYLIAKDLLKNDDIKVDGNSFDLLARNEIEAENFCLSGEHELDIEINPFLEDGKTRVADEPGSSKIKIRYTKVLSDDGTPLGYTAQKERVSKLYQEMEDLYNEYRRNPSDVGILGQISAKNNEVKDLEASLENLSAIAYYVKSQIFSNWVYDNLGTDGLNIKEKNIRDDLATLNNDNYTSELSDEANVPTFHYDFSNSDITIFDKNQNPENIESSFVSHKFDVIRNSIQYNLNLALSIYDEMAGEMDIRMPVMSDSQWEKILQNVSIVSFMQGFNCGLKYYNNYAIVSSTNNELTVIPNEIYYVKKDEYNTEQANALYHRIDCDNLADTEDIISFRSKEVKYDKIYDKNTGKYKYDHKNFACYNCIVGSNYEKRINSIRESDEVRGYNDNIIISALSDKHKKVYYRAVANARENIYKTNALTDSNGYETLYTAPSDTTNLMDWTNIPIDTNSTRTLEEIKAIEITVRNVRTDSADASTATFHTRINDAWDISEPIVLNFQETPQTITIPVNIHNTSKLQKIGLMKDSPGEGVYANILNVRIIYE